MHSAVFTVLCIVLACAGFIILLAMLKCGRFFSAFFLTALQGIIALLAANLAGSFIGVHIAMNWYSIGISAVGGTPAVILLLLADTIFGH